MAEGTKSTIMIAMISAISAILVAAITTYGTIAVSEPEAKKVKNELKEISDFQRIANLPIGTIVPSMLPPTDFAKEVGDLDRNTPQWVLADGQKDITNSRYGQLTGKTRTPDLRRMFLRGMYEGREVGSYQADAFASHDHKLFFHYRSFKGESGRGRPALDVPLSKEYTTPKEGADETRPKNVAVYFYIKIN